MKFFTIDNIFKWFFIASSIYYLINFFSQFFNGQPYFDSLISFLIESVLAFYFIKKSNITFIKENIFFFLSTMTGLMLTKSFFFYHSGLSYQISAIISLLLVISTAIALKQHLKLNN